MQNLELKTKIENLELFDSIKDKLTEHYVDVLYQSDRYFKLSDDSGDRLKLRFETKKETGDKISYLVRYNRPDVSEAKYSNYRCYPVEDSLAFQQVMKSAMTTELVISKRRCLYVIKNARIHLDMVVGLGEFLEIEIIINTEGQKLIAEAFMEELIEMIGIQDSKKIACGYRELLLEQYKS